ncbi:DegT/DnrJ/EryC1/StrS family aminotransferase [Ekhidna sp.]|uniref:DegT/DnrJ/EryC1/StrS family aminotransferase n=1 Tax=Ekhidna sp. TaxID=2608089 RepID=UPI00329988ED
MKIPVCKPFFWGHEIEYVNQAMQDGWISSQGEFINRFEKEFAAFFGYKYAVSVNNGTNALHLALHILELQEGDEVIIPDFTMIAPVFAILQQGCIPVPVDVDHTWNIDVGLIERYITERTKAILVVHNYGHPADMISIKRLCDKYSLMLIEDCAEAIGAKVQDDYVGSWGNIACFSFYANKIITTGEGGMMIMNDKSLFEKAKSKRNMSFGNNKAFRFNHQSIGFNYRMTNLQAAIGVAQLEFIDSAIEKKIQIAKLYRQLLGDIDDIILPPEESWSLNVYWVFGIIIKEEFGCSRNNLQERLDQHGIETRCFFTPVHQQHFLKHLKFEEQFPNSLLLGQQGLYLPSYMELTDNQIKEICSVIKKIHFELNGKGY